jgi:hypothetical protein
VDALAITGEEGRGSLRKAAGSWQTSIDPQISEWGNPAHTSSAFAREARKSPFLANAPGAAFAREARAKENRLSVGHPWLNT